MRLLISFSVASLLPNAMDTLIPKGTFEGTSSLLGGSKSFNPINLSSPVARAPGRIESMFLALVVPALRLFGLGAELVDHKTVVVALTRRATTGNTFDRHLLNKKAISIIIATPEQYGCQQRNMNR
jgi:hypothetical protein